MLSLIMFDILRTLGIRYSLNLQLYMYMMLLYVD